MQQWEYLEVVLNVEKRTWKDNEGRRGKLRKGSTALALNQLGIEGWELVASLSQSESVHRLLLKRPWPPESLDGEAPQGEMAEDAESPPEAAANINER